MNFCEGGRGEALKSSSRNGLNAGGAEPQVEQGVYPEDGVGGYVGMVFRSSGRFHLRASTFTMN